VTVTPCPNCASDDLRTTAADASNDFGLDLLPDAHGWFSHGTFNVVVCCNCGLTRFFASQEEIERIRKSAVWEAARAPVTTE